MTEPIRLSTRKSLYKPIVFVLDGKEYVIEKMDADYWEEISKFDKKAEAGDMKALYKQAAIMLGADYKEVRKLDIRDVRKVINTVLAKIYMPGKEMSGGEKAEKNVSKPGDKS